MQTLPPVIRAYLVQGKHTTVAKSLMTKYGLRIDQAGVLEQEIILMIMGIDNPTEFTQALAGEAKLDQQTISSITKDVNEQIFVPLREEMRKDGMSAEPKKPVAVVSPRTTMIPANPQMRQQPVRETVPVPKYFHLQNKIPVSIAPKTVSPPATSLRDVLASVTKEVPRPSPLLEVADKGSQTPLNSEKLLGDHEEPHIELPPSPKATEGAVRKISPPPNLPGAMPPHPVVSEKVQVASPPTVPLKPSTLPLTPSAKPYSTDPYREPIE